MVKMNSDSEQQQYPVGPAKLFKTVVTVDSIYGARHGKYVSEIHLAASAVKYSITQSKKAINIEQVQEAIIDFKSG